MPAYLWLAWPALSGPFIFDDFTNLKNLGELGDQFTRESLGRYLAVWQGNPGRPLAALSFLIEDHAWPSDPEAFKRNNLLFHLLVGIGVFSLSRLLFRMHDPSASRQLTETVALLVMAAWLLHPYQLSASMLVVQRMTILANGFMVGGLLLYLTCLTRQSSRSMLPFFGAVTALFVFGGLGFLTKENGLLIFAYATAINLTLARSTIARLHRNHQLAIWTATAGMAVAMVLAMLWNVRDPSEAYATRDFTLMERLFTEARVLWDYVFNILLPNMNTSIFHDDFPISRSLIDPWTTAVAIPALLILLAAAIFLRKTRPYFAFAVLWFLAGHLIESTIIPLELYFEHRNYLAMFGPFLAIVAGIFHCGKQNRRWLLIGLAGWLSLSAFLTHQTARTWGDRLELAEVWKLSHPDSMRATQNLAAAYVEIGDYLTARRILSEGARDLRQSGAMRYQRVLLDCLYGEASAEDIDQLIQFSDETNWGRVIPDVIAAMREHIGSEYCGEAITPQRYEQLVLHLVHNPEIAKRTDAVGYLYYQLALMFLDIDNPRLALDAFRESFEARPDPQVAINEALFAARVGEFDRAKEALQLAREAPYPAFKDWLHPVETRVERARAQIDLIKDATASH
ncbi:hypothetical protein [Wenzhouxiangella sp. EGI_FJ10305]|uniref:hypothetical protein n=1 Tax=Wenzhouxiangella sp. EGI_FJ10305 TaxID=3243768 RepID=UPI0035D8BE5D